MRALPTVLRASASRGAVQAPADRGLFVPHFYARPRLSTELTATLIDAQGQAYCQMTPGTHCVLALAPGRYRFFVINSPMLLDVIDVEVAAGRTYFAWIDYTNWGNGFIAEKVVPSSAPPGRIDTIWSSREVELNQQEMAPLIAQVQEHLELILHNGERRVRRFDAAHLEAHTIHVGDGM